jgi:uncharacterized glyoxalase superfamily protein PhnB
MAKTAKKTAKKVTKPARSAAKPKALARTSKSTSKRPTGKKASAKRIDPLNRKQYQAVTPLLVVSDMRRAIDFYSAAFSFKTQSVMDGPHGIMHAELKLRDTTLMLSPESRPQNSLSANTIGNTPATLYVLVENVDQVQDKAVAAGGKVLMPVMDMFWGDRCGVITDPDGNKWMIATHKSEPTRAEMAQAMRQMEQQTAQTATSSA